MDSSSNRNINVMIAVLGGLGLIGACLAAFGFLWPLVQAKASWPVLVLGASCVVALLIGMGFSLFRAGYDRGAPKE
ncbi:hypothetical protein ABVB18_21520 [Xanthomonas citri pv. mangiferaeindicae]|uniref:hypothetical protein n=1 Tax=Xanthomonas citri TaxID=346 RepID=UPI001115E6EF|nr:hypothetical protein [Xanthomonas citri]